MKGSIYYKKNKWNRAQELDTWADSLEHLSKRSNLKLTNQKSNLKNPLKVKLLKVHGKSSIMSPNSTKLTEYRVTIQARYLIFEYNS